MDKIMNWTFGAFFRTIGRVFAYIGIGIIAGIIINQIKVPKMSEILSELFIMKVDALSLDGYNDGEIQIANGQHFILIDEEYPDDNWNIIDFNSGEEDFLIIPLNGFEAYNDNVYIENQDTTDMINIWKTYIKVHIFTSDNSGNNACEFQNNVIVCPLKHNKTYTRIETHFIDSGPGGSGSIFDIRLNYHDYAVLYRKDSTIQINENYENAQDIINAINSLKQQQESETNRTIENQNQNTQQQINSQMVCKQIDKANIVIDNKRLDAYGNIEDSNLYGITEYINIFGAELYVENAFDYGITGYTCFYNVNKELISCRNAFNIGKYTYPENSYYFRSSIHKNENKPKFKVCQNGNQALMNADKDYQDNSDKFTNETQEMDDYQQKEEQILNDMNFTALDNLDITISPTTSGFIWDIVEGLRTINGKIVLLMTSVLGLGIIKMILNR